MSISLQKLRNMKGVRGVIYRSGELVRRTGFAMRGAYNFARLHVDKTGARAPVTAVVVGRNDDYMSDFRERLEATIEWNARHLADEVIFVEWNPPPERELLSLGLAKKFDFVRAYVVPPEIHDALSENPHVPLLEFHAKNVGIRRARTPWVLATNADAACGADAARLLAWTPLSEEVVWAAQRIDIPWREGRGRGFGLLDCLRFRRITPYHPLGTGEFALAGKQLWERVRGYDESLRRHRNGVDKRGVAQMLYFGARSERAGIVYHLSHPTSNTEGVKPHHGEMATLDELPYRNDENWGLGDRTAAEIAERVWLLK